MEFLFAAFVDYVSVEVFIVTPEMRHTNLSKISLHHQVGSRYCLSWCGAIDKNLI